MGGFPPNMFKAQGFPLLRSRKAPMKKPTERWADAPLGYRLNGHIRFRDPPCPEGQVGMGVNPTLHAGRMLSVQCVWVNEIASKTLLFCCRYATRFHMNFQAISAPENLPVVRV